MAITLGSNIASLRAQRLLGDTEGSLGAVFERLSSGQRINRASDDAASLSIADSLNTDQRVFSQAIRNVNDGVSALSLADAALNELSGIVTRIEELASQSANGSLSNEQRKSIDAEAQELREEFFRVSRATKFNDLGLFDGQLEEGLRLQAGYGVDGSVQSTLGGVLGDGTFALASSVSIAGSLLDVTTGDLNNDGNLDFVVGADSANVRAYLGNGDGTFEAGATIAFRANEVELRDVNNDGILDFVGGNANVLNVSLGVGDGTFQSSQTFSSPNTLSGNFSLGDFNGDGFTDVVRASNIGPNAFVFLGNGDGTLGAALTISVGGSLTDTTVGDFNGDGLLDFAATDYGASSVRVMLGNGDGSFDVGEVSSGATSAELLEAGDVNGDGITDLVTSMATSGSVSLLIGNGDGSFQNGVSYDVGNFILAPAEDLSLVDVNGDGLDDLVTAFDGIDVLFGQADGTFQGRTSYSFDLSGIGNLAAGDFDNDGVYDFAVASSATAGILTGQTREGLQPLLEFSLATRADALQALAPLSNKRESLAAQRGVIGAFQSRLESALNTLSSTNENYTAAESRLRDADVASEAAELTRLQILRESSAAVLAQANQQPAVTLQLLQIEE